MQVEADEDFLIQSEPRQVWFEDENYIMTYQHLNGELYIHIVINKITKKIFKDIKDKWEKFLLRVYVLGYEHVFTFTDDDRIVNMVGEARKICDLENGWKVFVWELK